MGWQRVRHDLATELNWVSKIHKKLVQLNNNNKQPNEELERDEDIFPKKKMTNFAFLKKECSIDQLFVVVQSLSRVRLFATPRTAAYQTSLSYCTSI